VASFVLLSVYTQFCFMLASGYVFDTLVVGCPERRSSDLAGTAHEPAAATEIQITGRRLWSTARAFSFGERCVASSGMGAAALWSVATRLQIQGCTELCARFEYAEGLFATHAISGGCVGLYEVSSLDVRVPRNQRDVQGKFLPHQKE